MTAVVHPKATLTPSKLDVLRGWLPRQRWFVGDPSDLTRVAYFRFVDPAGEVGLDSMIIKSSGTSYFVPVTWRSAPSATAALIGTLEHSELGTRYCSDAATDIVYLAEARRVIRDADTHSGVVDHDGNPMPLTMTVQGSGVDYRVTSTQLGLVREIGRADELLGDAVGTLVGEWHDEGQLRREILAVLR